MIEKGQFILLYHPKKEFLLRYEPGKKFQSHLGNLVLPEGLEFGQRLESTSGEVFTVLPPSTAELMKKVERKTTIIYPKDAGFMLIHTNITCGSRVAEVGSGSGALTVVLARAVGEEGRVFSYEKRPEFLALARENLRRYGLDDRVVFVERDVYKEGFGEQDFDAIFVDVPEPWQVVPHAAESLKPGHFWVSLSPNMEQVKMTVEKLQECGFVDIKTVEILEREILVRKFGVRPRERMISHTGYVTTARLGGRDD